MLRALNRHIPLWVPLLILVASGIAIGHLTINVERTALFAERIEVDERWMITSMGINVALKNKDPLGTSSTPLEIAPSPYPEANTMLQKDHWTYVIVANESAVNSITSGIFKFQLSINGIPNAEIFLKQGTADASKVEGATLIFDIGEDLEMETVFLIKVTEVGGTPVPGLGVVLSTSIEQTDGTRGFVPRTLTAALNSVIELRITNNDPGTDPDADNHPIRLRDPNGVVVGEITSLLHGETKSITFTASVVGIYTFVCTNGGCDIHSYLVGSTYRGEITVS